MTKHSKLIKQQQKRQDCKQNLLVHKIIVEFQHVQLGILQDCKTNVHRNFHLNLQTQPERGSPIKHTSEHAQNAHAHTHAHKNKQKDTTKRRLLPANSSWNANLSFFCACRSRKARHCQAPPKTQSWNWTQARWLPRVRQRTKLSCVCLSTIVLSKQELPTSFAVSAIKLLGGSASPSLLVADILSSND